MQDIGTFSKIEGLQKMSINELIDANLKRIHQLFVDGFLTENAYYELTKECLQKLNGYSDKTNEVHGSA